MTQTALSCRLAGLILAGLLVAPQALAGRTTALFEIEAHGVKLDADLIERLSDYLGVRMVQAGGQVITPQYFREKAKGMRKCQNYACRIKLARWLGASRVVITQILRFGEACQMTAEIRPADTEATSWAASVQSGCAPEDLMTAAESLAEKIIASQPPAPPAQEEPRDDPPPQPGNRLNQKTVDQHLKIHAGEFDKCVADQRRKEPGKKGRMIFLFTVEASGEVTAINLMGSTFKASPGAKCAEDVIRGIQFHPFDGRPVKMRATVAVP